jgi:hypothetical protein
MSTVSACGRETAARLAQHLIASTGAKPADRVAIVGREQIELLVALASRGFMEVTCADSGPAAGKDPVDVLIAPAVKSEADLGEVLACWGATLRCGGTLLIGSDAAPRLRNVLDRQGFAVTRAAYNILRCRKLAALEARAA